MFITDVWTESGVASNEASTAHKRNKKAYQTTSKKDTLKILGKDLPIDRSKYQCFSQQHTSVDSLS